MIYLDASVALAHLMGETRTPPSSLWTRTLVSSRLLEYELWTRINGYSAASTHGDAARALLGRLAFLPLERPVLARALEPFPVPLRTLDAIHLSAMHFLLEQGQAVELASYDQTMLRAADALGWVVAECG